MRMLRWICGKNRKDIIRNANIRDKIWFAPIDDKIKENRLRWFRHICRWPLMR